MRSPFLLRCIFAFALTTASASAGPIEDAFLRGKTAIARTQNADGSFTNLVHTSSSLYTTQLVFLYEYLGILETKRPIVDRLMQWTWHQQNSDGGMPGYAGGPSDVGMSVQAYLAARIAGESESTERMRKLAGFFSPRRSYAREFLVRPYLMAFGLDRTGGCLPDFVEAGALAFRDRLPWFKALLFPILHILGSGHLHALPPEKTPVALARTGFCPGIFADRTVTEGREEFWDWIEAAFNSDGTLFDYTPTTIPGLMALSTYAGDPTRKAHFQSLIAMGLRKLETFQIRFTDGSRQQSPGDAAVAETTIALLSMHLSGVETSDPMMKKAQAFLKSAQLPATGGFGMAKNGEKHPDSDDTSLAIGTLRLLAESDGTYDLPENAEFRAKLRRGVDWTLKLQNRDGGFATWEKDQLGISKPIFNLTGMVLSESVMEHSGRAAAMLALFRDENPAYARAHDRVLRYIRSNQRRDGSYSGTWFIDYDFGTAMAIGALATAPAETRRQPAFQASIAASLRYLTLQQRADGGFSESPESFRVRRAVPLAKSSPAQTGLIVSALLTFSKSENYVHWTTVRPLIDRAVSYLLSTQKPDGLWHDPTLTGVVFPKIEYAIYPTVQELAPLWEIGMYARTIADRPTTTAKP